jgi:hypothetical protein
MGKWGTVMTAETAAMSEAAACAAGRRKKTGDSSAVGRSYRGVTVKVVEAFDFAV